MQFTRPRCGCRCECSRRPNRRIPCTICHHLIGPGCCATDHELGALTGICHRCSEANPQEVDAATIATTEVFEAQHALSRSDTGFDRTCIVCEDSVEEMKQTFDLFDTDGNAPSSPDIEGGDEQNEDYARDSATSSMCALALHFNAKMRKRSRAGKTGSQRKKAEFEELQRHAREIRWSAWSFDDKKRGAGACDHGAVTHAVREFFEVGPFQNR